MLRKIFICFVAALLSISSNVFAAETDQIQPTVLTLERCLEIAYSNSQQLNLANKNIEIAQEEIKKAEAGFRPTFGYQLGYTRLEDEPFSGWTPGWEPLYGDKNNYSGKIFISQPLYTGGKLTLSLELAKRNLGKAMEEKRQAKQKLTYEVKDAYYQVWLAEALVRTAKASYDNLGQHVDQVNKLFNVGSVSKFELLRAQVQHEGLKPNVISAENLLVMAKLNLATLIGYDKDAQFTICFNPVTLDDTYAVPLTDLLNTAYQNRSELHQLNLLMEMSKLQTDLTVSETKPNASLNLNYEGTGTSLNPDSWGKSWNLVLGVQGNFFNPATKPNIESSKRQEELLLIKESSLRDQIRLEVQQTLQSINEAIQVIKAHQGNIELAKESLRMTQARFDAGMATTMDIMDAQLALDEAQNGYFKGINSYLTALAAMDLVTGKDF